MTQDKTALGEYEAICEKIERILKAETPLRVCFGPKARFIREAFELMKCHFDKAAKDEKVELTDKDKSKVGTIANLFLDVAAEQQIGQLFKDLVDSFLIMVFNWNNQFAKMADIRRACLATKAIIGQNTSIWETINLLTRMNKRLERTLRNEPPAFARSRHYLEELRK